MSRSFWKFQYFFSHYGMALESLLDHVEVENCRQCESDIKLCFMFSFIFKRIKREQAQKKQQQLMVKKVFFFGDDEMSLEWIERWIFIFKFFPFQFTIFLMARKARETITLSAISIHWFHGTRQKICSRKANSLGNSLTNVSCFGMGKKI